MTGTDLIEAESTATQLPAGFRSQPHNIEAEQALLGAILINNEAYHRVSDYLRAEHFYEPVHRRIFEAIMRLIEGGRLADHVTLKVAFDEDEALRDLDGARYLSGLARAAETILNAEDYGRLLHDLALKRGLIHVGEEVVNQAFDPMIPETGRDLIEKAEAQLFTLAQEGEVEGDFQAFPNVLTSTITMVEQAFLQKEQITGVPTGLDAMDERLGGLQPSDLIILAARPSMGKTALAINMAANAAARQAVGKYREGLESENFAVAIFSLEMSAEQLTMRLLSTEARIGGDDLRRGKFEDEDFKKVVQASQSLASRPLFIDDTPALSVAALRTRARRLMRRHGISLIVVDYLQLLTAVKTAGQGNRVQEISEITQSLKAIAKELNVPVLALSQLSRAVEQREDKRPQLSDLRESGSIEQDADVVMFIYRDEYYLARAEPKHRPGQNDEKFNEEYANWTKRLEEAHNVADVIIAKQRNGPIGNFQLIFNGEYSEFCNMEYRENLADGR